jgi:hypothetical protein
VCEIVEAVLNGKQPRDLELKAQLKPFPLTWRAQRGLPVLTSSNMYGYRAASLRDGPKKKAARLRGWRPFPALECSRGAARQTYTAAPSTATTYVTTVFCRKLLTEPRWGFTSTATRASMAPSSPDAPQLDCSGTNYA